MRSRVRVQPPLPRHLSIRNYKSLLKIFLIDKRRVEKKPVWPRETRQFFRKLCPIYQSFFRQICSKVHSSKFFSPTQQQGSFAKVFYRQSFLPYGTGISDRKLQ